MPRYVSTSAGLGRLSGSSEIELLDVPHADLGEALRAGVTADELSAAAAREVVSSDGVELGPPVRRPITLWAVGYAYRDHRVEVGHSDADEDPMVFLKASSSVTGPSDDVRLPTIAPDHVDYEGEIAVIIGRAGSEIAEASAWDHVLGYAAANDVSARDIQRGSFNGGRPDPSKAKSFDTFTPLGPCVCTLDEYRDPADVELRTIVDGEVRQHSRSSMLIHGVPALVAFISRFTTLQAGDVIITGTPAGVGHRSDRFLRPGSVVRVEVEGAGAIENQVISP